MESTTEPITDSESLSESPPSFDPFDGDGESKITATIVHHNGSEEVSEFTKIEEIDVEYGTVRVWYGPGEFNDYHGATITEVSP